MTPLLDLLWLQRWSKFLLAACLLALLSPNFLYLETKRATDTLVFVETIVFSISFWLFWFAVFKRISWALWLALVPALWWFPSLYLRWYYLSPINSTFYGMLADTHWQEIYEFSLIFGKTYIAMTAILVVALIIMGSLASRFRWSWQHRSRLWVIGLVPSTILLMLWIFNPYGDPKSAPQEPNTWFKSAKVLHGLEQWSRIYPLDLFFAANAHQQERASMMQALAEAQKSDVSIQVDQDKSIDRIILVIGESANAGRWGLYGFERDTTPMLKARQDLIVLNNVVSPSVATRNSVPLFITERPLFRASSGENILNRAASPSLLTLFRQANYHTYWLSNQGGFGKQDSPISIYAYTAQVKHFVNPAALDQVGTYDEVLIPHLQQSLKGDEKKFIVLHTMGSHIHYAHRYPANFQYFTDALPKDSDIADSHPNQPSLVANAYDNTTRYTDFVLNSFLQVLEKEDVATVLLYSSDHGQDVYEPGCPGGGVHRITKASFQVPAFVWANTAARKKNPQAIERLTQRANSPLMTLDYFNIMKDLAAVHASNEPSADTSVWTSMSWQPRKRSVGLDYGMDIDFDVAAKASACNITKVTK